MDSKTVSFVMNVMGEFLPKDAAIAVADHRNFIYYQPGRKVDLRIQPGDAVKEDTVTYKALTVRKKISQYIVENGFGIPYYGISTPILDDGNPAGCVTAIMPARPSVQQSNFLTVRLDESWVPVPYEEVMFLEAQNRKTRVKSCRGDGFHKLNLTELEMTLPDEKFIRVHRSFIININYIAEIRPDFHSTFLLIMSNGEKIQVSQTYASQFRRKLGF